jgi:hypothetical protein
MGSRIRSGVLALHAVVAAVAVEGDADAASRPLVVVVHARVPIRVQIALSPHGELPCDSSENVMVFDGAVDPRVGLVLSAEGPICIRHTFDDFPEENWGSSQLWYRWSRIVLEAHVDPDR